MNATQIIFEVLTSGGAWSHEELQAKTDLPLETIRNAMHVLRRRGHQAMEPNRYVATEAAIAYVSEIKRRAEKAAATRAANAIKKASAPATAEERSARQIAQRNRDIEAKQARRNAKKAALAAEGQMTWADTKNKFVHKRVAAPAVSDSIVSTAVQSRPALQAAWSVAHA
jgi:hypothetical protein